MCLPIARLTNIAVGTCCCHPPIPCVPWVGVIMSAAPTVIAEGLNVARLGDIVVGCHKGRIITCSLKTNACNRGVARITDRVDAGCPNGTIVTGATRTFSG